MMRVEYVCSQQQQSIEHGAARPRNPQSSDGSRLRTQTGVERNSLGAVPGWPKVTDDAAQLHLHPGTSAHFRRLAPPPSQPCIPPDLALAMSSRVRVSPIVDPDKHGRNLVNDYCTCRHLLGQIGV